MEFPEHTVHRTKTNSILLSGILRQTKRFSAFSLIATLCLIFITSCSSRTDQNLFPGTPTPQITETVVPSATPTITNTTIPPEPSPTATATTTVTPTATVDPDTAAKIAAIREAVGDQVEDWVTYHNEIAFYDGHLEDLYEVKLVYTGSAGKVEFQELLDGNGVPIGKIWFGFTGQILIGDELRELVIPFTFEDFESGQCMWLDQDYLFDCALLTDVFQTPDMTIERKGTNNWNAVPGQVITIYLKDPKASAEREYQKLFNKYVVGREGLFEALVTKGDTSIGLVFSYLHVRGKCDSNNLYRVPFLCYEEADRVVIPGY